MSGCALATVLGVTLGLLRAAGNPLLGRLVDAYVEVVRNTPLVLQLFFWIALTRTLPPVRQAFEPLPFAYLSVRGVFLPWITVEGGAIWPVVAFFVLLAWSFTRSTSAWARPLSAREWLGVLACGRRRPGRLDLRRGRPAGGRSSRPQGLQHRRRRQPDARIRGDAGRAPVYYAANIAEIVRSGLQSVTRGQWEAGRALGLHRARILQLVVLPQAMRVITPLMTSTWLDLTKDTTLGVLIGFTEVTAVIKTSANNTGNAVETILVLVVVFLAISLPVSAAINAYNRMLARRGVVDVMTILLEGAQLAQPKSERLRGRGRPLLLARQRRGDRRRRRADRRSRFGSSPAGPLSTRPGRAAPRPAVPAAAPAGRSSGGTPS